MRRKWQSVRYICNMCSMPCRNLIPKPPLYFDPYPEGEDNLASPIASRHHRRALRRAGPYTLIMAETYRLCCLIHSTTRRSWLWREWVEWQRLVTSNFVRASSLRLRLCLHPMTTPGQEAMTMARGAAAAANPPPWQSQPLHLKSVPGTDINTFVLGDWRVHGVAKCSNHWADPGRIFERQVAFCWTV